MAVKLKVSSLKSWDEVNEGVRRMGEIDIQVAKLEGEMTLKINDIRANYDARAEGLKAERKRLEEDIEVFCEARKEEFLKDRTRHLTFGDVSYRLVKKIIIRSKEACTAALEALNLLPYLRVIKEPNKEAMAELDAATLAKVGAKLDVKDRLRIEPNLEKIKG